MKSKFSRLDEFERVEIYKLLALKLSISEIARRLGRNKSSISRELRKQGSNKYDWLKATWLAVSSRSCQRFGKSKMNQNPALKVYVLSRLKKKWSPDQISVSLKMNYPNDSSMQLGSQSTLYLHPLQKRIKRRVNQRITPA